MTCLKSLMLVLALSAIILPIGRVKAIQSSGFTLQEGDWYDSFGIDRNRYDSPYGYLPNMAYETLGSNQELAYSTGVWFKDNYQSTAGRAEAILRYVQTWTEYGYDSDNVVKNGVPQEEWAWNADEMANRIDENTGTKAVGDCEDMAFLCATIYTGAGIETAVVDAPEHVACLIWLPDYPNANNYWDLSDGKGAGWIWVEATGSDNPLGWTPPDFNDGNWYAFPISASGSVHESTMPISPNTSSEFAQFPSDLTDLAILGLIAFVIIIALALAGSRRRRPKSYFPPPPPGWGN